MARVGSSLRSYMLSKSAITSLIGQRMYPNELKQNANLPAVVYRVTNTEREHHISDASKLAHARVELYIFGATIDSAEAVADAIRTCGMTSYRGTTGSIFFNGIEITTGDSWIDDPPTDGNQSPRSIVNFDLMVHYTEAT